MENSNLNIESIIEQLNLDLKKDLKILNKPFWKKLKSELKKLDLKPIPFEWIKKYK